MPQDAIAARTADRRVAQAEGKTVSIEVAVRSRLLAARDDENSRSKMQKVRIDSSVVYLVGSSMVYLKLDGRFCPVFGKKLFTNCSLA